MSVFDGEKAASVHPYILFPNRLPAKNCFVSKMSCFSKLQPYWLFFCPTLFVFPACIFLPYFVKYDVRISPTAPLLSIVHYQCSPAYAFRPESNRKKRSCHLSLLPVLLLVLFCSVWHTKPVIKPIQRVFVFCIPKSIVSNKLLHLKNVLLCKFKYFFRCIILNIVECL